MFKWLLYLWSGGGFQLSQTSPGQLADFNMWKREMTVAELNALTCGTKGDVVSWATLREKGHSKRTERVLPGCDGVYIQNFIIATFTYC